LDRLTEVARLALAAFLAGTAAGIA
jgi:hypothetical protein